MKDHENRTFWLALTLAGIIIALIIVAVLLCGCGHPQKRHEPPLTPRPLAPPSLLPPRDLPRIRRPETLNGGNGGASIASLVGHVVSYDAACSNEFAIFRIEWHPCETNQFDHWETVTDTNGIQTEIGRWYCGTNVLRWNAEAGPIYVPEYLDGTNWISDAYFTTNAPGLLEVAQLHYLDTPPHRIWRIAIYEPRTPGGCVGCEPVP